MELTEIDHSFHYQLGSHNIFNDGEFTLICNENNETQIVKNKSINEIMQIINPKPILDLNQIEVIDLLIGLAKASILSQRHKLVFNPKPEKLNIDTCRQIILDLPPLNTIVRKSKEKNKSLKLIINSYHMDAYKFIKWIIKSCELPIYSLLDNDFSSLKALYQYRLISDDSFSDLKKKHGVIYAFHGSIIENWHSILRNGLKICSGTNLMLNGAASGKGIYCSKQLMMSFSQYSKIPLNSPLNVTNKATILNTGLFHCIALCEIIDDKSFRDVYNDIVVVRDASMIRIAYLFTYSFLGIQQLTHDLHTEKKPLIDDILNANI
jgi:hypothetical protein